MKIKTHFFKVGVKGSLLLFMALLMRMKFISGNNWLHYLNMKFMRVAFSVVAFFLSASSPGQSKCDTCYVNELIYSGVSNLKVELQSFYIRRSHFSEEIIRYTKDTAQLTYDYYRGINYGSIEFRTTSTILSGFFQLMPIKGIYGQDSCYNLIPDSVWTLKTIMGQLIFYQTWMQGIPHGQWYTLNSGKVIDGGMYLDGHPVGEWTHTFNNGVKGITYYDNNGNPIYTKEYFSDSSSQMKAEVFFRPQDRFAFSQNILIDTNQSHFIYIKRYFKSGNIESVSVEEYANARVVQLTQWYDAGPVRRTYEIENGVAEVKNYYENGDLKSVEYFRDAYIVNDQVVGKKVGTHIFYNTAGQIYDKVKFSKK